MPQNTDGIIQPAPKSMKQPSFSWQERSSSFQLFIPKVQSLASSAISAALEKDFTALTAPEGTASAVEEGWDDVVAVLPSGPNSHPQQALDVHGLAPSVQTYQATEDKKAVTKLPSISRLERPAQLFQRITPSVLTVEVSLNSMYIQCSHEPSLDLIAEYFTKWGTHNRWDSVDVSRHHLHVTVYC
jgi:hypothetical protein